MIDHRQPLSAELRRVGIPQVDYVESLAPQCRLGLTDDPEPFDIRLLKRKAISLHWEMMFTRAIYRTPDMSPSTASSRTWLPWWMPA